MSSTLEIYTAGWAVNDWKCIVECKSPISCTPYKMLELRLTQTNVIDDASYIAARPAMNVYNGMKRHIGENVKL